jgi:lactoylglutathione lyase
VVPDVRAEQARFAAEGLRPEPVKEFHRDGALMARFFFVTDPDGYRIEVLEQHGRYR